VQVEQVVVEAAQVVVEAAQVVVEAAQVVEVEGYEVGSRRRVTLVRCRVRDWAVCRARARAWALV